MGKAAALESLDYAETLAAVARLAVPEYADWCFVGCYLPGMELAAAYRPAGDGYDVGGDFYTCSTRPTTSGIW